MKNVSEYLIRIQLSRKQKRFGDNPIRHLLSIIDEQRGTIAMNEAHADEMAVKAAAREAKIQEQFQAMLALQDSFPDDMEQFVVFLRDGLFVDRGGVFSGAEGDIQIELRNLRAQLAEAHAAGHPVNLFEELANEIKGRAL